MVDIYQYNFEITRLVECFRVLNTIILSTCSTFYFCMVIDAVNIWVDVGKRHI